MSTTTIPGATSTTTSPATTSSGITLPSSTVISIGLGFVAVALGLLFLTISTRLWKIHQLHRQARARGEDITFRDTWRSSGGWWGYFTSGLGGESTMLGAGGMGLGERERRWMEILGIVREEGGDYGEIPEMFEVVVENEKGNWVGGEAEPLALHPWPQPSKSETSPKSDPNLHLSLLILMPSQNPIQTIQIDTDAEGDIPDLVIGTTSLQPMINPTLSKRVSAMSDTSHGESDEKGKGEVKEVENVDECGNGLRSLDERRARWVKKGERWGVEGVS